MDLHALYEAVLPQFPAYAHKDLKTAVRVLAKTLGFPEPHDCPHDAYRLPLRDLAHRVDTYLSAQGKSRHTLRNTKHNLSRLFRLAEAAGFLQPIAASPQRHFTRAQHDRTGLKTFRNDGSYLRRSAWPPALQEEVNAFVHWATAPVVPGRDARLRKRPVTVAGYLHRFEDYFGYLTHQRHVPTVTFDYLFDPELVRDYVYWTINEKFGRHTHTIDIFLKNLVALTNQYRPLPALREQVKALQCSLPPAPPFRDKNAAWLPLSTLQQIGQALWPTKAPRQLHSSGTHLATHATLALLLQLWAFRPYRARNICEMGLTTNLYQDPSRAWRIRFAGEQLKVPVKNGKVNTFDLHFPLELVPTLETYLHVWRPILTGLTGHTHPHVFLNQHGKPYHRKSLALATKRIVFAYTGNPHWHPHIVRTVWATEFIRETGDFYTAAVLLNDTLKTVTATYAHLRAEGIAEKADRLIAARLGLRN